VAKALKQEAGELHALTGIGRQSVSRLSR